MRRLLAIVTLLVTLVVADLPTFSSDEAAAYDKGAYGNVPMTNLRSAGGKYNRFLRSTWTPEVCEKPDDQHYILAVHGFFLAHAGPMILNQQGHQVFYQSGFATSYGLDVQTYKGEKYLTWWTGNNRLRDHGKGYYYMMDKNYNMFRKLSAVGDDLDGDLHEFTITKDNTAIISIYNTRPHDLSEFNITRAEPNGTDVDAYINESMFQELDIETNELLFEWRATDHIPLSANYGGPHSSLSTGGGRTFDGAWDWFHINSIDKDDKGNYLVSSRYAHALFYIDGQSGDVLWQIGGKNNSFTDLSGGRATSIARQHHARWTDNYRSITVFDNGEEGPRNIWRSRGLKIAVDTNKMEVSVIADAYHPHNYTTISQGSAQQLDNGNLLVGWGNTGAFTEFSSDGKEVLCDWQFAALFAANHGGWSAGAAEAYRVYQKSWKGEPLQPPDVKFGTKESMLYVSWNGATELRQWRLEGSNDVSGDADAWKHVSQIEKQGFESNITVDADEYMGFRLTALDKNEESLGMWALNSTGISETLFLAAAQNLKSPNQFKNIDNDNNNRLLDGSWHLATISALAGAFFALTLSKLWQSRRQFSAFRSSETLRTDDSFSEKLINARKDFASLAQKVLGRSKTSHEYQLVAGTSRLNSQDLENGSMKEFDKAARLDVEEKHVGARAPQ